MGGEREPEQLGRSRSRVGGQPGTTRQPAVVRAEGIRKSYGNLVACSDIDFDVRAGEVHAVLGENGAGKSTLMKVLFGLVQPEAGRIWIHGEQVRLRSPRHARAAGIGMVFQHFELVDNLTVAENVALGISWWRPSRLRQLARELAAFSVRHNLEVDPDAVVGDLPIGLQQRVEIVKALFGGAEVLIMDEPTAVLSPVEWTGLQKVIRSLADEGRAIIFIGHKLHEALAIADRCTVLRNGERIGTIDAEQADRTTLATMMIGRDVNLRSRSAAGQPGSAVLELRDVSARARSHDADLSDLSLTVRQGEIFGVAGIEGNGQQTLLDLLSGLITPTQGSVEQPGEHASMTKGIIPADRHGAGSALDLPLRDNLIFRNFRSRPLARRGLLQFGAIDRHCGDLVEQFDIRAPGLGATFDNLSGGNQQKAVIARELHANPALLVAAHPTRGLDVGAIEFVYEVIRSYRASGGAVLLISGELDEILALADRFVVLLGGRASSIMHPTETSLTDIGLAMTGAAR